jgi:hypothetical protein
MSTTEILSKLLRNKFDASTDNLECLALIQIAEQNKLYELADEMSNDLTFETTKQSKQ